MLRRRKHGIDQAMQDVPVGLFCFELLYADGEDLTMLPYPERRARVAPADTPRPPLRRSPATQLDQAAAPDAALAQAGTHRREGRGCKTVGAEAALHAGGP